MEELNKASHREFSHGFYYNKPTEDDSTYDTSDYIREYSFIGVIRDFDKDSGFATIEQRNKFVKGDKIEIFGPVREMFDLYENGVFFVEEIVDEMYDENNNIIESAPHPKQIIKIKLKNIVKPGFIMRKRESE